MLIEKMIRFVEKETILLLKQFFKSPTTNEVIFCFSQRHLYSFVYTNTLKIATTIQQKIMGQLQDHPFPPEG